MVRFFLIMPFLFVFHVVFAKEPLSIYLTLDEDPLSKITIRWITDNKNHEDEIYYRPLNSKEWTRSRGSHVMMPNHNPYFIHCCQLSELEPGTSYEFKIDAYEKIYSFKTFSKNLDQIRFVVGGDMLHDDVETLEKISRQAVATDPDFAILGGDIAYSAPKLGFFFSENVNQWLDWLKSVKKTFITKDNRLIPLIVAIGNHEVVGRYDRTPEEATFFYTLFRSKGQRGYLHVDFADYLSIIVLDSGHTNAVDGKQKKWLEKSLKNLEKIPYKYAVYHVPAYPSVRKYNQKLSIQIREHWVPLFEKYQICAAFEHHDHAYKRTFPLLRSKKHPEGILYIGDGAWGIKKTRTASDSNRWYLEKTASKQHFILVTLSRNLQLFEAIDANGHVFDRFFKKIAQLTHSLTYP